MLKKISLLLLTLILINPCFAATQLNISQVKNLQTTLNTKTTVSTGTTSPTTIPTKVGDIFIDTSNINFYRANGTSSSADWVLVNGGYSISSISSASTPADATTYYYGEFSNVAASTVANCRRVYVPRKCKITSFYGTFMDGGLGSTETSTISIRVNNTTDYTVSETVANNTTYSYVSNTALNIPLNAGDYYEIKWVTPTWATNPTSVIPVFRVGINL